MAVVAGLQDKKLTGVRLAVGCVGPVPMRLSELEAKVEGTTLEEGQRIVREARDHLKDVLDPVDDLHGSVEYKTYLTGVLLGRGLAQATGANGGLRLDRIRCGLRCRSAFGFPLEIQCQNGFR